MSLQTLFFENLSPKQTVFKNSFWLFLSQGIGKFFKFFLVIAAARILGPTNFGAFNYLLAAISLFFIFSDWGLGSLVIRDYQQKTDKEKYFRAAASLKIILIAASFLAALIGSFFFHSLTFKATFILLAIFLVISNIRDFVVCLFRAFQKMEREFWVVFSESFSLAIIGIFLLLIYKNIISLGGAYLASGIISFLMSLILIRGYFFYFKPIFDRQLIKEFLINGAPIMLFGLLSFIFFSTDQILLGKLKGTTDVGYYSIVTKIILLIGLIPGLIMTALFPHLSSKINDKEFMKKIFKKVGWGFLILGFSLAVLGAVSAPIIPLIVGSQYGPSVKLFQFFIWILIFMSPTILFDSVLFAYNKQWLNFWFTGGCAILNLVLNLLLIPRYGIFGAAAASIVAQFLNFTISWYLSRRVMNDALKLSAVIDNP